MYIFACYGENKLLHNLQFTTEKNLSPLRGRGDNSWCVCVMCFETDPCVFLSHTADLWLRGPPHATVQTTHGEPIAHDNIQKGHIEALFWAMPSFGYLVYFTNHFESLSKLTCPRPWPQPSLQDYYGITFPGPAALSGRDGSLANNPYSGMIGSSKPPITARVNPCDRAMTWTNPSPQCR